MGHQVFEMDPEVELETDLAAGGLVGLEGFQGAAPLGGDLGEGQIGAAQLGTEGVHPHEDLGDLVVGEGSLQHVHPVDVLADTAQPGQALAVFLVALIVETANPRLLQEGSIAIDLEHLAHLHPLGQLLKLAGGDHKGHAVEALLQFVF